MPTNLELASSLESQASDLVEKLRHNPVLQGAAWVNSELSEIESQLDGLITDCDDELAEEEA